MPFYENVGIWLTGKVSHDIFFQIEQKNPYFIKKLDE